MDGPDDEGEGSTLSDEKVFGRALSTESQGPDVFFMRGEIHHLWDRLHFVVTDLGETPPRSRNPMYFSNNLAEATAGTSACSLVPLETIVLFIHDVKDKMEAGALSSSKIVYYLDTESDEEISNMVFLLCCYLVLEQDFSPGNSVSLFESSGVLSFCHLSIFSAKQFGLAQSLIALQKASMSGIFDHLHFDVNQQGSDCGKALLVLGPGLAMLHGKWQHHEFLTCLGERGARDVVFLRSRKSDNCGRVGAEHQEARDDAILNDGGIRVKRFHHLGSDDLSCIADASAYIDGICGERLNPAEGILLYVGDEESSKSVGMCLLAMHLARHHSFTGDEAVSFLTHCNNMLRSGGSCWVHTLAKLLSTSPGQDQGQGLRPAGPWIPCGPSDVWALGCAGIAKIRGCAEATSMSGLEIVGGLLQM